MRTPPEYTLERHAMLREVSRAHVVRRAHPEARNRFHVLVDGQAATPAQAQAVSYLMGAGMIRPQGEHPEFLMAVTEVLGEDTLAVWSAGGR